MSANSVAMPLLGSLPLSALSSSKPPCRLSGERLLFRPLVVDESVGPATSDRWSAKDSPIHGKCHTVSHQVRANIEGNGKQLRYQSLSMNTAVR